jgi:hypothetical protein
MSRKRKRSSRRTSGQLNDKWDEISLRQDYGSASEPVPPYPAVWNRRSLFCLPGSSVHHHSTTPLLDHSNSELFLLGRTFQRGSGAFAAGDYLRDVVEVASSDLVLMLGRSVTERFGGEFGFL